MDTFDIIAAFEHYLKLMKLEIKDLSIIQLVELKNAFIGGCGYMFRAMERAGKIPTDLEVIQVFEDFEKQIKAHFEKQLFDFQSKWN